MSKLEVAQLIQWVDGLAARIGVASPQSFTLAAMAACAIYTGMRKGELFGLRWIDVHLDVARLDVSRSYRLLPKSGKARHVPMHPTLVRVLRAWKDRCPRTPEGHVFPIEPLPGRWRMGREFDTVGLADALTGSGCHLPVDGHVWHMLRHTFASHFMMSGGNVLTCRSCSDTRRSR